MWHRFQKVHHSDRNIRLAGVIFEKYSPRVATIEPLLRKMMGQADSRPDSTEVLVEIQSAITASYDIGRHAYFETDVILFFLPRAAITFSSLRPR